jgi:hypothetical protein
VRKSTAYTLFFILMVILVFSGCERDLKLSLDVVQKMINLPENGGITYEIVDPRTGKTYFVEVHRLSSEQKPNPKYALYSCKICPCPYPHCWIQGQPCVLNCK